MKTKIKRDYVIRIEGRDKKKVFFKNNIIRVEVDKNTTIEDIKRFTEFKNWEIREVKGGHEEENRKIIYIELLYNKNNKRFAAKTGRELGRDDEVFINDKLYTTWHIIDKITGEIVEGYANFGEGAKTRIERDVHKLNSYNELQLKNIL